MDRHLRDLLDAAVGQPPHRVSDGARAGSRLGEAGDQVADAGDREDAEDGAVQMTSSSSPPSAWARWWARTRTLSPAESQNCVWAMSATSVLLPCAAASSRAARNPAALVISISSGAVTTGTPLTTSTGKLASCISVTSCDRNSATAA